MAKNGEKKTVRVRMDEIFELALEDERGKRFDLANRKFELIHLYSSKYKTRVLGKARTWICKKCKRGIYSGGGRIRINRSSITVSCNYCGHVRRIPIPRR